MVPSRALGAVSWATPLLVLATAAWQRRWMSDDGFINLRVVAQISAGNGPVFNAGERVEAGTSTLWVALLSLGDLVLPVRLEWIAVFGGIGLTLVGLAATMGAATLLWQQLHPDTVLVPVGALCLVAVTPVWDFASSGPRAAWPGHG
ncbi:MAG: hypothetical protein WKF43_05455 [Acidimicrobiales bacterium]